jgi:hypothetical protein
VGLQNLFCPPVLWFCRRKRRKEKKWHFCLLEIKVATLGVSLWYFHVYMYYNPNWFISCFSSFYLGPFLMVVLAGLRFFYSFLYREYINHIHLLSFLLLPSPFHMWPPLSVTCFSEYLCVWIRSIFHIWKKTCGFWLSGPG